MRFATCTTIPIPSRPSRKAIRDRGARSSTRAMEAASEDDQQRGDEQKAKLASPARGSDGAGAANRSEAHWRKCTDRRAVTGPSGFSGLTIGTSPQVASGHDPEPFDVAGGAVERRRMVPEAFGAERFLNRELPGWTSVHGCSISPNRRTFPPRAGEVPGVFSSGLDEFFQVRVARSSRPTGGATACHQPRRRSAGGAAARGSASAPSNS